MSLRIVVITAAGSKSYTASKRFHLAFSPMCSLCILLLQSMRCNRRWWTRAAFNATFQEVLWTCNYLAILFKGLIRRSLCVVNI
ncbi:hypothetical protein BDR05DRAFT_737373 [Suillus weaverae]|nr:hypothetical protein BDR05DRAFT_737373 [Suillus weaverae]